MNAVFGFDGDNGPAVACGSTVKGSSDSAGIKVSVAGEVEAGASRHTSSAARDHNRILVDEFVMAPTSSP